MPSVLTLIHSSTTSAGWLGRVLDDAGVARRTARLYDGEPCRYDGEDAVVVFGGPMGAYDEAAHPFLVAEKAFLRDLVARDVPVLGICLGSQLLADALGGRAYLAAHPEVAFAVPERTEAGRRDPVVGVLDDAVLTIHQDTFELPPGAEPLARTDGYLQAFRAGSALALQFHAEADADILATWLERPGLQDLVRRAGRTPQDVLAEARERAAATGAQGVRLFEAWAADVLGV